MLCDTCSLWQRRCVHTSIAPPNKNKKRTHCAYYRKKFSLSTPEQVEETELVEESFDDLSDLIECSRCRCMYRPDQIEESGMCLSCQADVDSGGAL